MQKIELKILGLSYSQTQSNSYALILGEKNGHRRLPIVIGHFEAQSIALEIEKMKPARPLTHDLFKNFADTFNIGIEEVIINKFQEGIFFALLVCNDGVETKQIDSRTSDAVALAIRFGCPIYTYEPIMAEAGILFEEEEESAEKEQPGGDEAISEFRSMTNEELEEELHKAVDEENYEKASQIRDEINKRKPRQGNR
ncbi:MAG TPA: bifunctional nuclease family protein [Bacteroidales bacterium]|nr:bifunctional nuclease family protein [Bacteroidales bacterium]HPT01895.1 bifunctional nuclease family protein [Bacteroidales bacterium]